MEALGLRLSPGSKACDFARRNYTRLSRALADSRRVAWRSLCAGEHSAFDTKAPQRFTPSHHDDGYPVIRLPPNGTTLFSGPIVGPTSRCKERLL
jgi:hypothetical protein